MLAMLKKISGENYLPPDTVYEIVFLLYKNLVPVYNVNAGCGVLNSEASEVKNTFHISALTMQPCSHSAWDDQCPSFARPTAGCIVEAV